MPWCDTGIFCLFCFWLMLFGRISPYHLIYFVTLPVQIWIFNLILKKNIKHLFLQYNKCIMWSVSLRILQILTEFSKARVYFGRLLEMHSIFLSFLILPSLSSIKYICLLFHTEAIWFYVLVFYMNVISVFSSS